MTQEPTDFVMTMPIAVEQHDNYDEAVAVAQWFRCLEQRGGEAATEKPDAKRVTSGELVLGPDADGEVTTIDLETSNLEAWIVTGKAHRL